MSQKHALWFSPDGTRLAYVQFNDSQVEEVRLPVYEPTQWQGTPYPRYSPLRYPKAGTQNPTVALMVVDLKNLANERAFALRPPKPLRKRLDFFVTLPMVFVQKVIKDRYLSQKKYRFAG